MKKSTLLTIMLLLSVLLFMPLQYTKANNWVEVARFEGPTSTHTTEPFTCNYSEWRITWELDAGTDWHFVQMHELNVTTYRQGETANPVDVINGLPTQGRFGIHYIRNQTGTFYMNISSGMLESYSVIVEQNLDSVLVTPSPVPTPPTSTTPTTSDLTDWAVPIDAVYAVAVVAAVVVIVVVAVVVTKRRKQTRTALKQE